jgi:hypothetical protein
MATLSKHGSELLRIAVETEINDPESSTTWERLTRAYMSDGKILEKRDVRFKPSAIYPNGENYTWGWKLGRRQLKPTVNVRDHAAKIEKLIRETPNDTKWTIVSGGMPVVMISEKRILAAIEADENTGFCKACGAEAYNVEPDARNYRCESCGQMEVYGAEEMLISA